MSDRPISDQTAVRLPLVAQFVVWLAMALLTYGAINARISVVETKQGESERRMERIENKLDRVLDRLK